MGLSGPSALAWDSPSDVPERESATAGSTNPVEPGPTDNRLTAAKGVEGAVCVCPLIAAIGVCPLFGEGSFIGDGHELGKGQEPAGTNPHTPQKRPPIPCLSEADASDF
jgi:hypothetical protein